MNSDDAGKGVAVAQEAIRYAATKDEVRFLKAVNTATATGADLAWAVGYLASAVWETTLLACGDDPAVARRALLAATGNHIDGVLAQAAVIIAEAARDIT